MERNFKSWVINIVEQNGYKGGRLTLQSAHAPLTQTSKRETEESKCTMYSEAEETQRYNCVMKTASINSAA